MAFSPASKRAAQMDYKQLNSLCSVVLYDTATTSRKKGKFYDVERIITRRRARNVSLFLVLLFGCMPASY